MSNYAERNLNRDEKIVFEAKKNILALMPSIIWCVLALVGVIVGTVYLNANELAANIEIASDIAMYLTIALWGVWLLIGVLPFLIKLIKLMTMCLCITNKRVIGKIGVLKIETLDYPIEKVDNVSMKAGMFGNLFHYHQVTVLGGGGGDAKINFVGISNASQFKNAVTAAVEQHAEEARKAQAEEIARAMGNK